MSQTTMLAVERLHPFPANCSDEQMKRDILRGLELLHRQRSRGQER